MAVPVHLSHQLAGQSVDHRGADPVKAPRGSVGSATELASCVEFGQYDLQGRDLALGVPVNRDAPTVVGHLDRLVAVQGDLDPIGEAGRGLVDGVVHKFPDQVHQTGGARAADVHAGPLADRL